MSCVTKKLMSASGGAGAVAIEDAFSTFLYTGNGSTQTITNDIDLAGDGGLVWAKGRSGATDHQLFDTLRGATKELISNSTAVESTDADTLTTFNANGFSLGADANVNTNAATYASWTFRKAPRFFDVVTYTGNGASQTIPHNLGVEPGCIIVKNTGAATNWAVYHRGTSALAFNQRMQLNLTDAVATSATAWNGTAPTDTEFSVGNFLNTNASGNTYVAYLFAHDPLGPSEDGSDGLIACGSYVGNGSATGPVINLGWEPQWLLIKYVSTGDWNLVDNMRGFTAGGADAELNPNLSAVESTGTFVSPTATGFQLNTTDAGYNQNTGIYTYIAIRAEGV